MRRLIALLCLVPLAGCLTFSKVSDSNGAKVWPPPNGETHDKWCQFISDGTTFSCVDRGLGGLTATGCAGDPEPYMQLALADTGTAVFLELGVNDVGPWPSCNKSPSEVADALAALALRVQQAGKTVWVATVLPLTDADPNDPNDYSDIWNAKIDTLNAAIRLTYGTHVVEFHDAVLGSNGKADPALYRTSIGDTVHLNDDGEHVIEAVARATLH